MSKLATGSLSISIGIGIGILFNNLQMSKTPKIADKTETDPPLRTSTIQYNVQDMRHQKLNQKYFNMYEMLHSNNPHTEKYECFNYCIIHICDTYKGR